MKTNSRDGTIISYRKHGQGSAVILLDGALCSGEVSPMLPLIPLLSGKFLTFHYDRRGRFESGDAAEYSPQREIEDLKAMIEVAGGSAMVFGMSSGAALAARAAAERANITKLILYEPPFHTESEARGEHLRKVEELNKLLQEDRLSEAVTYFQVNIVGIPRLISLILRMTPLWSKLKRVAPTLRYDLEILGDGLVPREVLKQVHVPTVVMGGEKSPKFLRQSVDATAAAIPNSKKILLSGQTHNFSAKKVAPSLIEFFS